MTHFDQDDAEVTGIDDAIELVRMNVEPGGVLEAECDYRISCSSKAYLLRGPVHVAGDLELDREKFERATVVIAGGLAVDGVVEDYGGDGCTIVVMGDLVAEHLLSNTSLLVRGDVKIAGTVVGHGGRLLCDGDATCHVLITSDYAIDAKARVAVDVEADAKRVDCVRDDGSFDFVEIMRRLKADEPILESAP